MWAIFKIIIFACILSLAAGLVFVWELNTYGGPGCAQFEWSIFLNRRWLLKLCVSIAISPRPGYLLLVSCLLSQEFLCPEPITETMPGPGREIFAAKRRGAFLVML